MDQVQPSFLRPIPEDRSDAASSTTASAGAAAFRLPPLFPTAAGGAAPVSEDANSSTRANMENGADPGSEVSSAAGILATADHQTAAAQAGIRPGRENRGDYYYYNRQILLSTAKLRGCRTFWTKGRVGVALAGIMLIAGVLVAIFVGTTTGGGTAKVSADEDGSVDNMGDPTVEPTFSETFPSATIAPTNNTFKVGNGTTEDAPYGSGPADSDIGPTYDVGPEENLSETMPGQGGMDTSAPVNDDFLASQPPEFPFSDPSTTVAPEILELLDTYLLQIVASPNDLLYEPATSQARDWMLYTDLLRDDVLDEGAARVHQRFALVQLYYATAGWEWYDSSAYLLPDVSECRWLGVTCSTANSETEQFVVVRVQLAWNNLRGTLPVELSAGLAGLQELNVSINEISGTIPARWFDDDDDDDSSMSSSKKWDDMFNLDLSQNALTGSIPAGLWRLPVIRFVYLSNNRLFGLIDDSDESSLPSSTSSFLQYVWLYDNLLTGHLPFWFSNAMNLQKWIAWGNHVNDTLPAVFPPKLSHFDMSGNALSGTLPDSLWSLSELQILYLDGNRLTGPLPAPGDATLPLQELWLHNNTLSGVIPNTFGHAWKNLTKLLLNDNAGLTGVLGEEGVEDCRASGLWESLLRLEADCVESGGEVVCDCCTNDKCQQQA